MSESVKRAPTRSKKKLWGIVAVAVVTITAIVVTLVLVLKKSSPVDNYDINNAQEQIRSNFKTSWDKFIKTSKGADEINPITGEPKTTWGGWGVTLIDSLDTLYIMNLTEEFDAAVDTLSKVDFTRGDITTAFFEVVIRNLGGLLSAYDLSGKKVLLNKARELADLLLLDFESPSGLPYRDFDFKSQKPVIRKEVSLASVGSCQMEFARLSLLTGDSKYRDITFKIFENLEKVAPRTGWYPLMLDTSTNKFITKELSFGADGDSFFEYLLKVPMMVGSNDKNHDQFLKTFQESMDMMQNELIRPCNGDKICLGKLDSKGEFAANTQHLEFFMAGLLLLGGDYTKNQTLSNLGYRLLDSFMEIPKITATGLAPEVFNFYNSRPFTVAHPHNGLRPELIESLFYAYRYTKDTKYQQAIWSLFLAFEKYSKVEFGYATYKDVTNTDAKNQVEGSMPSYFFAETFKYIYLAFTDSNVLPLEDWVLNTEAHPLRRTTN